MSGEITDLVRTLVSVGATPEQILAAVATAEATKDAALETSREKARARFHKWKSNQPTNVSKRQQTLANSSKQLAGVEDSSSKKDNNKEEKIDAPAALTPRAELESVLDSEHAAAVVEHRQRLKKPLTAYAAKQLAKALSKAPDANAAADLMIVKGWQSYESHWGQDRPNSTAPPKTGGSPKTFDEGGAGPRGQTKFLKQFEEMQKSQAMPS